MEYKEIIRQELNARKTRDPNYSLRSFAKDMELSPSSLSEMFSGKHHLSIRTFEKIAGKLNLGEGIRKQTIEFLNHEMNKNRSVSAKRSNVELIREIPDEVVGEVSDFLAKIKTQYPGVNQRALSLLVENSLQK